MSIQTPNVQDTLRKVSKKLNQNSNIKLSAESISNFLEYYEKCSCYEFISSKSTEEITELVELMLKNSKYKNENGITVNSQLKPAGKESWKPSTYHITITTQDTPFIIDSILMILRNNKVDINGFINISGVRVKRDAQQNLKSIYRNSYVIDDSDDKPNHVEATSYFEISRVTNEQITAITTEIITTLNDVKNAVRDWRKMQKEMRDAIHHIEEIKTKLKDPNVEESIQFLTWLVDYFAFFGSRNYTRRGEGKNAALHPVERSSLGVLNDESLEINKRYYSALPPEARKMALSNEVMIIADSNTRATIHRNSYTNIIIIKNFDENGEIKGERRFIGLFTSDTYDSDPSRIPILRLKVSQVVSLSGLSRNGYLHKKLIYILRNLPRQELLQATTEQLSSLTNKILMIQNNKKIKIFTRVDPFMKYVSCIMFFPRHTYNTQIRKRIENYLSLAMNATQTDSVPTFTQANIMLHTVVRIEKNFKLKLSSSQLEEILNKIALSWNEELKYQCQEYDPSRTFHDIFNNFSNSFPEGYQEKHHPSEAVNDIYWLNKLITTANPQIIFYQKSSDAQNGVHLKIYNNNKPIALSKVFPVLENMGFLVHNETTFCINPQQTANELWINDLTLSLDAHTSAPTEADLQLFKEFLYAILYGNIENDTLNRLSTYAKLSWKQVLIARIYTNHLAQLNLPYDKFYISKVLVSNPNITALLTQLFSVKFDHTEKLAHTKRITETAKINSKITKDIDKVSIANEYKVLNLLSDTMNATVRTTFYTATATSPIGIKLDNNLLQSIPNPKAKWEMYVYHSDYEGIHLRTSKVARGGIRISTRIDYRTEVLGLMTTQQVKNSIIVPSGAKGGLIVKNIVETDDIEARSSKNLSAYQSVIETFLEMADNLDSNGKIITAKNSIRYDDDDYYFVVAADKGTATYSDYANSISLERNYWLGDAFASGGSEGYDHKKMGITAKGAWQAVLQHFSDMNIDIATTPFTVSGIGDMAGDVFGNGMLLSKNIKLIAAFNHRHIFIDPQPDPETSFAERQRLFNLPRSSWADYNTKLISKGGGIFDRSAKIISLSAEAMLALGTELQEVEPEHLIKIILQSPVDLLWNGGIGTYVKADYESHLAANDEVNNACRVNASNLRCKIIGEGGNNGLTQPGRIQFSLAGGRINGDFIDNSAGVDCSDHEVNIKIMLNNIVANKKMSMPDRNKLLRKMQPAVAQKVLDHNIEQNMILSHAISTPKWHTLGGIKYYIQFIEHYRNTGELDVNLWHLPNSNIIEERLDKGLSISRPELAVLLSFCKNIVTARILDSDITEDNCLAKYASNYFPTALHIYDAEIHNHGLNKEITALTVCNTFIADMGITFILRMHDRFMVSDVDIIKAYLITTEIIDLYSLKQSKSYLSLTPDKKMNFTQQVRSLIENTCCWLLRYGYTDNISVQTNKLRPLLTELHKHIKDIMTPSQYEEYKNIYSSINSGYHSTTMAKMCAYLSTIPMLLSIIDISPAKITPHKLIGNASTYFEIISILRLNELAIMISTLESNNRWQQRTQKQLHTDLDYIADSLAKNIFASTANNAINKWKKDHSIWLQEWYSLYDSAISNPTIDYVIISSLIRYAHDNIKANL